MSELVTMQDGTVSLSRVFSVYHKLFRLLRGLRLRLLLRACGGRAGRGLQVERGVLLRWGPHRGLRLGNSVYLGRGVILDVPAGAALNIGDRVKVMHYVVIAASESINIGPL